jgi:hypothetical protein
MNEIEKRSKDVERNYTDKDINELADQLLARFSAQRPVPSSVTLIQAAEILGVSVRTAARFDLPRNEAGRINYEDVLRVRANRSKAS